MYSLTNFLKSCEEEGEGGRQGKKEGEKGTRQKQENVFQNVHTKGLWGGSRRE